jgi:ABC-2 type transport system ATP-binding protein
MSTTVQAPSARDAATRAAPAIQLENASRWYGNVVAVNNVTCRIDPGITGLLGPNGAGKSTVLNMMAGLLRPSSGAVRVNGDHAAGRPCLYREVGLVHEREAVHPFLTGFEFVRMNARLQRLPDADDAAIRAIRLVDMEFAMHRRIAVCSKGMRQRIKVAGALVHDPNVILLDEPFNGMDPRQRLHMTDLLRALADGGRLILISSHILEELDELATNVLVMVAGRLAASGHFREIRRLMTDRPHTFTLRSSNDRGLAAALTAEASVFGIEIGDGSMTVRVSERGPFTRALPRIARDAGIRIFELRPTDESLESVFSYLVNR